MSYVKNDSTSLVIFVLAIALVASTLGWIPSACFAAGWIIRNYMWVRNVKRKLPGIIRAELAKTINKTSKLN